MSTRDTALPIRAATEVLAAHGITPDRCDVLQNGHTLVLRLTADLVARVVQDVDGPRQGTEWFARENAIAHHLTEHGAPVIPLHPALPPEPHFHLGYPMNFWQYVRAVETAPLPAEIGRTLHQCHAILASFPGELSPLAIITESLALLEAPTQRVAFAGSDWELLHRHLSVALDTLGSRPFQPLHGDAHMGNLMNTTAGLLWTDWEDAFSGPVEWDVASIIWNARLLEQDHATADAILAAYRAAGGEVEDDVLYRCLVARAAVMSAWYPTLYPDPGEERRRKLRHRLDWLATQDAADV